MNLLELCLAAYGGLDRWRAHEAVDVRVSARGLAFALKGTPRPLTDVHARPDERPARGVL